MQGKQIRTLALVLGVLAILAVLVERPWAGSKSKGGGSLLYPSYRSEAIDRIYVVNRQDTVNLARRDQLWIIDGSHPLPADTASVHRALESVAKFKTSQLASKNVSKFGVFEVDSTGAQVKLYAGSDQPAIELILGKATPEGGTYIRPAGKDQVYSSPDRVRSLFARNSRAWQDRKMFDLEPNEMSKLTVEHGDSTFVFEKNAEGKWSLVKPDSFEVKQEEVDPLLRGICKLTANGFTEAPVAPDTVGLAGKPATLRVKAEKLDGAGIELQVGKQGADALYYAKAVGRDWIYKIAKYRVDPYYKDVMTRTAPPAPPPAAAPPAGREGGGPAPATGGS
jgi:hypothetical protein